MCIIDRALPWANIFWAFSPMTIFRQDNLAYIGDRRYINFQIIRVKYV
jgi:hypothetical protein